MIPVSAILADAAHKLVDEGMVTYTQAHLLGALNNACRVIASVRLDACVATETVALQAGTRQQIPAGGQQFLSATRNMDSTGRPGTAIQKKTVIDKNRINPGWHTEPEEDEVLEVMPDEDDPVVFWVYPPVKTGTRVQIKFAKLPDSVEAADPFPLLDKYAAPAKHWVLFEMFSRDTNSAGHPAKAESHKRLCFELMGMSVQTDGAAAARSSA